MKRFILFVTINLIAVSAMAQLTKQETSKSVIIGQVKSTGQLVAQLSYKVIDSDTLFLLMYRDMQYSQFVDYKTILFGSEGNTKEELYQLLKTTIEEKEKGYSESVKLGETNIIIKKDRMLGVNYVWIHEQKGFFQLTMKQLDKLFSH